jgi:uncharacterized membrane protein YccC
VRKYGQRWFAVGMIGFMAYFMGDYLRPLPADIGWLALAAAVAFAVTHVVTNFILPDDPERDFRRALGTIDQRINLILRHLLRAEPPPEGGIDRKPLQRHLSRLHDIVLMAEGFIPQGEDGSLPSHGPAADLAIALFDLQLAVERMVRASLAALPPDDLLRDVLYRDDAAIQAAQEQHGGDASPQGLAAQLLIRVHRARAKLDATLGPQPSPAFVALEAKPKAMPATPAAKETQAPSGVPADLRLPIQVTLACAIALTCGLVLSQSRWYWAVITAFIVFNNTKSRADTAFRALQRSGGTFAGLIGGTIAATLLHGNLALSAVAIPILFFLAFYFLQASYGVMIFFITVALALLYGVMGSFSPELLELRLAETVIGSLAGTLVAFLVFPNRASDGAALALDKYLVALKQLIAAARRRAHGDAEPQHLRARSRLLDRAYTDLANAVRPLGGAWGAVTRFGAVRETLLLLTGCVHWARVLARSLRPGETLDEATLARFDEVADEVEAQIARIERLKATFFERPKQRDGALPPPRPPLPMTQGDDPTLSLEVISALLARAARTESL